LRGFSLPGTPAPNNQKKSHFEGRDEMGAFSNRKRLGDDVVDTHSEPALDLDDQCELPLAVFLH
jgi:hypothetical protein